VPFDKDYTSNPSTPPLPLRALAVGKQTAEFEAEITLRTKTILRMYILQIRTTEWETEIDKLVRHVNVRLAYDNKGINLLPVYWRPAFNEPKQNWWIVLRYSLVGLVHLYYEAIVSHDLAAYESHAKRLEFMLDNQLYNFKLSPAEPSGYVLRTQDEWKAIVTERDRRAAEILDTKDRLGR